MNARMSLLVALLASSAAACAPSTPAAAPAPRTPEVPPVRALLSERERLSLTGEQVVALDSIARDWDATNTRLHRKLGAARGKRPAGIALALRPEAPTLRAALAENNQRALRAVEKVLSDGQRAALCGAPEAPRMRTASLRAEPRRPAWHWCGEGLTQSHGGKGKNG